MMSPYKYLCTVRQWPLPAEVDRKFHYFRNEKSAMVFAGRYEFPVDVSFLDQGATLLKPVSLVVLEFEGQVYDCRHEFPYETSLDEVREAWWDTGGLGCDCGRGDVLIRNGARTDISCMGCGREILRLGMSVVWESDSRDFLLH